MKEAIFLDFDGVIVDSISECFCVSLDTYYHENNFKYDNDVYKNLFYKYRYLVGPVYQFMSLHKMLEKIINTEVNESESIKLFNKIDSTYYNNDYRFSYEIIAQSYYLKLKIDSVPVRCDYNNQHTTMPLSRAVPCIIHAIKIGLHYRLAKLGKKLSIFKI